VTLVVLVTLRPCAPVLGLREYRNVGFPRFYSSQNKTWSLDELLHFRAAVHGYPAGIAASLLNQSRVTPFPGTAFQWTVEVRLS
jgi:hypothetical protein